MQPPPRRSAGFTLIELMIVVAIIGILSAVAYPSYQKYVRKSRRADAHALLQAAALAQEKYRINHTTYYPGGAANGTGTTVAEFKGVCIVVGTTCKSPDGYYTLSSATAASPADQTGYTLTATPQGSQAQDTACATITLGVAAGVTSYGPTNTCWNK